MKANWEITYQNAMGFYDEAIVAYKEKKFDNVLLADILGASIEKMMIAYFEYVGYENPSRGLKNIIDEAQRAGISFVNEREFKYGIEKVFSLKNPFYVPDNEDVVAIMESASQVKMFVSIKIRSKRKNVLTSA